MILYINNLYKEKIKIGFNFKRLLCLQYQFQFSKGELKKIKSCYKIIEKGYLKMKDNKIIDRYIIQ